MERGSRGGAAFHNLRRTFDPSTSSGSTFSLSFYTNSSTTVRTTSRTIGSARLGPLHHRCKTAECPNKQLIVSNGCRCRCRCRHPYPCSPWVDVVFFLWSHRPFLLEHCAVIFGQSDGLDYALLCAVVKKNQLAAAAPACEEAFSDVNCVQASLVPSKEELRPKGPTKPLLYTHHDGCLKWMRKRKMLERKQVKSYRVYRLQCAS